MTLMTDLNLGHSGKWDTKSVVDVLRLSPLLLIVSCTGVTQGRFTPLDVSKWDIQVCISLFYPLLLSRASLCPDPIASLLRLDCTLEWVTVSSCSMFGDWYLQLDSLRDGIEFLLAVMLPRRSGFLCLH